MEMNKIKVAMLCGYPLKQIYGGVAMHVDRLTYHLSKMNDIELHVISFGDETKEVKRENLIIHFLKRRGIYYIPIFSPIAFWLVRRKVMEIDPDIVHVQGTTLPYVVATILLRNKYPTIVTIHGVVAKAVQFEKGMSLIRGMLISKPLEKYAISKIPHIIVCSPAVKYIIGSMTNSKIYVIPNGADFENIQNVQVDRSINHPNILYVGVLEKVKGVDVLIRSIPIIKKSLPNIHVYIAGNGSQETELKRLAKELNIEETVKFLGYISGDEKYSYYKSADTCILPSRSDSAPLALLEAMACKKPVVASNVGGIPYVVEDGKTGLLFKCSNTEDLAEKTIILLKNKELREKMGKAGRERAKEFTWDNIAERTVEVYRGILQSNAL